MNPYGYLALASAACVLGSFYLAGVHHDIAWRLRQRRRRGYLTGGDR